MIYHSLFHWIMSYGIIFWGNSPHSFEIFKIQTQAIRATMGYGYRESCRKLFMELKILPFTSKYVFFLLEFVVNNRNYFHLPQATLVMYQKGVFYLGIKVFNSLPRALKDISSKAGKFKIALRKFLQTHSFYSLDKFLWQTVILSCAYHAVIHTISIHCNTVLCKKFVHIEILYCVSITNHKPMASLYYRANLLPIPTSIGYILVYSK